MTDVRLEIANRIATVTLSRPPVNALTGDMFREIAATFASLSRSQEASVVVLTAPGERVFCAGVDLDDSARRNARQIAGDETVADLLDPVWRHATASNAVMDCSLPVIGAINGAAVGAGAVIAACCDLLVASTAARFSVPEIKVGVLGGGRHLQRLVGTHKARRMFFTGEFVSAEEFHRLGAIESVVAPAALMDAAYELATTIASHSPIGLRLGKESLNRVEDLPVRDGYRIEQSYTAAVTRFNDSAEARTAQQQKRNPNWTWS